MQKSAQPLPDHAPAGFAAARRGQQLSFSRLHPALRTALLVSIVALQLGLLRLLDYRPPPLPSRQPGLVMVALASHRPPPRIKLLVLRFVHPSAPRLTAPQIIIARDIQPASRAMLSAAMAQISPLSGGAGGPSGDGGAGPPCMDAGYTLAISRHIEPFVFYPRNGGRVQGVVYVHFVSDRAGAFQTLDIEKSSGHPVLDHAALQIMQRAAPLPPIPGRLNTDAIDAVLPIVFGNNITLDWTPSGDCLSVEGR
jgi:protein TonB